MIHKEEDIQFHSMRGAGVEYKNQKYITHSTLPISQSALQTFSLSQRVFLGVLALSVIMGFFIAPLLTFQILVGIISVLYFIDTVFNLTLTLRSLHKPSEISVTKEELASLTGKELPVYTILCPLYKEAHVVPQFVSAIEQLDWPKDRLEVMLLLEEDDVDTIATIGEMDLPAYIRKVIVPHSLPKTKPKACNYGLSFATGEYLVIYDAEDIPDPLQLKKAYLSFQKVPSQVKCLQAKLNYYNARQNILTRFFAAEYSLWFDLTLTGLQSFNSTIPLGGTSNHFRTHVLRDLQGWDPFNVTEDADLGIRLFKRGYQTAIIDSTTYEEATSMMKNWIRQRSRWIKGYMQTYLVHMRTWDGSLKEQGPLHYLIFQLTVGGKLLFILLNPFMWIITLLYFTAFSFVGPVIEEIYQPPISYIAVFSWIFGNFLFLYYYMLGCAKRNQWDLMKYVFMVPFYWGMMSTAGAMALYQLILKPHYWEKTVHGFHLSKQPLKKKSIAAMPVQESAVLPVPASVQPSFSFKNAISQKGGMAVHTYSEFAKKSPIVHLGKFWRNAAFFLLLVGDSILAGLLLPPDLARMYVIAAGVIKILVLFAMVLLNINKHLIDIIENNVRSFFDIFKKSSPEKAWQEKRMKILVFNWRDTKHIYGGGAEVYVHELAKRWVKDGNKVTVFSGNDQRNLQNEKVDGVEIIRRGGTYTVYLFAFIYYILKFRGKYDVIVDCENGIPFFTPLYTRKPVILLVHHVHQEVFRVFLKFPLNAIAAFLEGKVMPLVYRNKVLITVSESSKREIVKLGFTHENNIEIIYNGVSQIIPENSSKTVYPSFMYLGRLKDYKNIDVAIKAFANFAKEYKYAKLSIVGSGESLNTLKQLVTQLQIDDKVEFLGRVSEEKKAKLLAQAWAVLQPSQVEGWGITVIEANAAGTPVIASRVNGLQDSVVDGKTGMLVEVNNTEQFAAAMKKITSDAAFRNSLSQGAYVWSKNFDWDKSANNFYRLIGKSLDSGLYRPSYGNLSLVVSKKHA